MNTMYDRDSVVRHASEAARLHSQEVREALAGFLSAKSQDDLQHKTVKLRDALVALTSGFESSAHDGSTAEARREAAGKALSAWDGPSEDRGIIRLGSKLVRCSISLACRAGWSPPFSNDETRALRAEERFLFEPLAQALGEGLDGDDALLRAIAIRSDAAREREVGAMRARVAEAEARAAGMHLAAEREASKRVGPK